MREYLEKLNPEQQKAALYGDGPLLILAGAGSGKTKTMTCRIAHLIEDCGVSPYHILAVTFTNKAAGEMRERLEAILGENPNMWILTFHSACLRMLRKDAGLLGYKSDFAIYDPADQKTLVRNIIKAKNMDEKRYPFQLVLSVISNCKEKRMGPEDLAAQAASYSREKGIAEIYAEYQKELKKNNAMDFDDLLLNAVKLLEENPTVLEYYRDRFEYIMVDEYQDTNNIQYRFVQLLAQKHGNICVVGDDDQCIYEWRGADITNILNFERDFPGAAVIKLEQNYRSYGNILDAAHSVIKNNRGRKDKKLWTGKEAGEKIHYKRVPDEREEAREIAREIQNLVGSPRPGGGTYGYKNMAVLYRTNVQSRSFEEVFPAFDLPYRVLGGLRYYDRKEIKDMMAYMRLVQNPADDLSLLRIINEPKRGIGEKSLEKLRTLASVRGESLFATICDEEVIGSLASRPSTELRNLSLLIGQLAGERNELSVEFIYDILLEKTGYLAALQEQKTIEAESRIENLMEFKSAIVEYADGESDSSLESFMEHLALMSDIDNHDPNEDAVTLMTMHSAKGLEFPVVFLPGMEEGLFPGMRAMDKAEGLEEERRLCYVAMTRAMDKLYLYGADKRTLYGRTDYSQPSSFLKEIDPKLLDGDTIEKQSFRRIYEDGYAEPAPIQKPYDRFKAAQAQTANAARGGIDLAAGDRVRHKKFGEGLVLEVDGRVANIVFDEVGLKKLATDIAPLEKI